jgi:hypothetical protein
LNLASRSRTVVTNAAALHERAVRMDHSPGGVVPVIFHRMFFADLTPYEYGYEMPRRNILNVGWLGRGHAFPMGAVPDTLVGALRRLIRSPENLYRGYHRCEFCPDPPVVVSPTGRRMSNPPGETMGNGEIRVAGLEGVIYVAPVLVAHYVEVHDYRPPEEFIRAVLSADEPTSGCDAAPR